MIDETFKLIAVPYKLRRINDIDYRKKAFKNAIEIYYRKDIDQDLLEKIITSNKKVIHEYEKEKEITEISHNLVKSIIQKCLIKFDK
tara:strand:+ start:3124 stop:3384 length:261 start_codon:yes stop_codon:yes gene_type:complete